MKNKITLMNKDEVIQSIQQTVNMFCEKVEDTHVLFVDNTDDFEGKEDSLLKEQLKGLVDRLKQIQTEDLALYNQILKDVKNISPFEKRVQDLSNIQKFVSKSVISKSTEENSRQLAQVMKSSDIFDFINRDKKDIKEADLAIFGSFEPYVKVLWKQVKQEELLGLLIYVNSGKAAKDFEKLESLDYKSDVTRSDFLYSEFKRSFLDLSVQNGKVNIGYKEHKENKVSAAKHLDYGVIINHDEKELHFGFATSKFNTESQQKQFFIMMKELKNEINSPESPYFNYQLKPIYITNSIINENELRYDQSEKQKPFLKTFAEELTKEDRNSINTSSFLSLFNNIQDSDYLSQLLITDLVQTNPYISGSDTLPIYEKFEQISKLDSRQGALELRNYLLESSEKLLSVIEKVKVINLEENANMHYVHGMVWNNLGRMLFAAKNNFVGIIDKEDFLDDKFCHSLGNVIKQVKEVYLDRFMGANPHAYVNFKELFYGARDIKGNMEEVYEMFESAETRRISQKNQTTINFNEQNYILDATNAFKKIEPLLRDMKIYSEDELNTLRERTTALYEMIKTHPAISNVKDLLNASAYPDLREWGKSYNKFYLSGSPYGKVETKREIVRNILENVKNLDDFSDAIKQYHHSYMEEKKNTVAKLGKKI